MPKQVQPAHGLTLRAEKVIQRMTGLAVLVLAVAAAVLSFSGLQKLALDSGFDPSIAWLLPVIVDGMVLTGSLGVIAANMVGLRAWYEWMLTILGVGISVAGNVAAAPANLTAQLVHAIAPVTFALSIEGMLRIYRASAAAQAQREAAQLAAEEKKAEREARAAERAALKQKATGSNLDTKPAAAPMPAPKTVGISVNKTAEAPAEGTARTRIKEYLATNPDATAGQVSRDLGTDPSYTRKIVRDFKERVAASPAVKPVESVEAVETVIAAPDEYSAVERQF